MPISNSDLLKIIAHFLPGDPLSYKLYDDGSLVVIAATGKKHTFSADQVTAVHNFMKPDPGSASSRTRGMPSAGADGQTKPAPAANQAPTQSKTRTTKGPAASKTVSKPKSTA
jgi:hypothetical protein